MPATIEQAFRTNGFLLYWYAWGVIVEALVVLLLLVWMFTGSQRSSGEATVWRALAVVAGILGLPAVLARLLETLAFEMRASLGLIGILNMLALLLALAALAGYVISRFLWDRSGPAVVPARGQGPAVDPRQHAVPATPEPPAPVHAAPVGQPPTAPEPSSAPPASSAPPTPPAIQMPPAPPVTPVPPAIPAPPVRPAPASHPPVTSLMPTVSPLNDRAAPPPAIEAPRNEPELAPEAVPRLETDPPPPPPEAPPAGFGTRGVESVPSSSSSSHSPPKTMIIDLNTLTPPTGARAPTEGPGTVILDVPLTPPVDVGFLVVFIGGTIDALWPLDADKSTTIGRDPGRNVYALSDQTVSGRHLSIAYEEGAFVLTDAGSTNGTKVNGSTVSTHRLHVNDVIEVGEAKMIFMQTPTPSAAVSGVA